MIGKWTFDSDVEGIWRVRLEVTLRHPATSIDVAMKQLAAVADVESDVRRTVLHGEPQ